MNDRRGLVRNLCNWQKKITGKILSSPILLRFELSFDDFDVLMMMEIVDNDNR